MRLDDRLTDALTDALDAAARTVPDNAVPPALPERTRKRPRKAAFAVVLAVAAVVAAVAVPLTLSERSEQVAGGPCPTPPGVQAAPIVQQNGPGYPELNKLPFGSAPKVPFTMMTDLGRGIGYLEDGRVRVPLPAGYLYTVVDRISCGWVVTRFSTAEDSTVTEVGIVTSAGRFQLITVRFSSGVAVSPDGTEVVSIAPDGKGEGKLSVLRIATGEVVASYPAGADAGIVGWNDNGIWYLPDRDPTRTRVWQPGKDAVAVDTAGRRPTVYRSTERVLLNGPCTRVATLDDKFSLHTVRELCAGGTATLSPDGKVLVAGNDSKTAGYLVDTGARTRLSVPATVITGNEELVTWEDATHVIGTAGPSKGTDGDRDIMVRCDVLSGKCERFRDGPASTDPRGPLLPQR